MKFLGRLFRRIVRVSVGLAALAGVFFLLDLVLNEKDSRRPE